ncbi:HTH-type transcriptional repressor ComR [Rubripirellula lacrimiformis]|uniref:HTH-type transcriptional repressor ComR n=1 Tax=Rubripirellula lacrimiformis TaxID=1930273 RepID=A0A517NCK7_9BACT|nr:TetR/AcrR family transcriptional regulator [Rubripirellula lacrimiformis]QDT04788.1 HTH-type transcriptional repressor ComR [Rubripirellula lacrimiformis]
MPWEKSFEESDVVEKAMLVFWQKGYDATSISDILLATGIKRSSLYNAFGGKDDLFLRSLLRYDQQRQKTLLRRMDAIDDPCECIAALIDHVVSDSLNDPSKKGCLLVNTSLDYSHRDAEIQKVVTDALKELTTFFEKAIRRGQDRGDIPASVDAKPTARALLALVAGIRVLGRGPFTKTALLQIAEQAKRLIC